MFFPFLQGKMFASEYMLPKIFAPEYVHPKMCNVKISIFEILFKCEFDCLQSSKGVHTEKKVTLIIALLLKLQESSETS